MEDRKIDQRTTKTTNKRQNNSQNDRHKTTDIIIKNNRQNGRMTDKDNEEQ